MGLSPVGVPAPLEGQDPAGLLPRGLNPLGTRNFKGFFKGGRGWGSSLYRLPSPCHAESLIPAVRFLRKEKSSLLRAGYFLRRTEYERSRTRSKLSASHVGMSFFFTKKWVGGRSSLRKVPARQGAGACARPPLPQKKGIQGDLIPLAELEAGPRGLSRRDSKKAPGRRLQPCWKRAVPR